MDVAKILARLVAEDAIYNTTMMTEFIPNGIPGNAQMISSFNYRVRINNYFSNATKLGRAAIILHELVHVYFFSLFDEYHNGVPQNTSAYNDFAVLFQHYVEKEYPGSSIQAHHDEMATTYVNVIASALQEFNTGVPIAPPAVPDQIYLDLAWGGLRDAPIFNILHPNGSVNAARINSRYSCEILGQEVQGQNPAGQNCN